jgi:hypothetical protein
MLPVSHQRHRVLLSLTDQVLRAAPDREDGRRNELLPTSSNTESASTNRAEGTTEFMSHIQGRRSLVAAGRTVRHEGGNPTLRGPVITTETTTSLAELASKLDLELIGAVAVMTGPGLDSVISERR